MPIKHELIRMNAAYFLERPSEIALIIQRIFAKAHTEPEDKADAMITRFIASPTVQHLITDAYQKKHDDLLILLLLTLNPNKLYTKQFLDTLQSSKYAPSASDDLITNIGDLDYLNTVIENFNIEEFNDAQQVKITEKDVPSRNPDALFELIVRNKLRKRIIEAVHLNHCFYTEVLISIFNRHKLPYLLQEEDHLPIDLLLLINNEDNWPLIERIITSDEHEAVFLLCEFLDEAISSKNKNAFVFLLNLEIGENISSKALESLMRHCNEDEFHEGITPLKEYARKEEPRAARTMPYNFFANKRRKIEQPEPEPLESAYYLSRNARTSGH